MLPRQRDPPVEEAGLVLPEDMPLVQQAKERLRSGESTVVSENRNLTKDGEVIICAWHNSVLRGPDGRMSSILSLVEDVTQERHAMAVLEKTVRSLGILVSNSGESMVLFDTQGAILCASEHAAASVDSTPEDLQGKSWSDFLPPEQLLHARFCLADLLANQAAPMTTTLKLRTARGTVTWFGLRASVVSLGDTDGFLVHLERI